MKKFRPEGKPAIIFFRRRIGWIKTFLSIFSSLLPAIIRQAKFTADFEANILWGNKKIGVPLSFWQGESPLKITKGTLNLDEEENGNED